MKRRYYKQCFLCTVIILSILLSSLIYVGYLGIKSYRKRSEMMDFSNDYEKNRKNIENSINISMALGRTILTFDDIKDFAHDDATEYRRSDFNSITNIYKILFTNQAMFSNSALNMALFKENSDIVITSNETIQKSECMSAIKVSSEYITEIFQKNKIPGYYFQLLSNPPENNKIYIACEYIYSDFSKVYLCIFLPYEDIHYVPVKNTNKTVICSGDYETLDYNKYLKESSDIMSSYIRKVDFEDEKSILFFSSPKNMPNVVFVSCYKYGKDGTLLALLLLALLLGVLLAVLLSVVITKLIYKPIQALIMLFENANDSTCGYNELEYISDSASMILDANQDLHTKINDQENYLKRKFIFDLINGFVWGNAINTSIDKYNLVFLKSPCRAVLFKGDALVEIGINSVYNNIQSTEGHNIFTTIKSVLLGDYSGEGIILENNEFVFIVEDSENIKHFVMNAINKIRMENDLSLKAVISDTINTTDDYKYIYSKLIAMYEQRHIYMDLDVLIMDKNNNDKSVLEIYSLKEEKRLFDYLLSNQYERGMLYLHQLLERLSNEITTNEQFDLAKTMLTNTVKRLSNSLANENDEYSDIQCEISEFEHCKNYEDFIVNVYNVFKKITYAIHRNMDVQSSKITDNIIKYINDNLSKDLSMDDISEQFGISKSTITRRLKERDILFKTYINDQRIIKAKEIMEEKPNMLVKDIAESVGFTNIVSFNRLFKKAENVSPKQYMENLCR